MKKILTIVLCIVCTFSAFSVNVFAEEAQTDVYTDIEYLDDGYYIVTTVVIEDANPVMRATYGKTGAKTSTLYNADDEAMVTLKLTASFSYTGTSSNCTSASTSYTIHEDSWKVTSATATKSGNKATGNFTSKHYVLLIPVQTINSTITLTCSNTGVLS